MQQQTRVFQGGGGRSRSHAENKHDGSGNERIQYSQAMATRAFCRSMKCWVGECRLVVLKMGEMGVSSDSVLSEVTRESLMGSPVEKPLTTDSLATAVISQIRSSTCNVRGYTAQVPFFFFCCVQSELQSRICFHTPESQGVSDAQRSGKMED